MFSAMRRLLLLALVLSACTPIEATRGQLVTDEELNQLKVGTTAKAEVIALLGTPTTVATFNDKQWYYIGEDTKQIGIHPPVPTKRRIVALTFDDAGTLIDEKILGKDDAQKVAMAPGETKVIGTERTIVQQLIGNVGRFNQSGDNSTKSGNGGGPGAPKP